MSTWMKQCLYLFFNYFMDVFCLHDEVTRLPIGKQSSRSAPPSSLLISPTHTPLLTWIWTCKCMFTHTDMHTHTYACASTWTWTYTYTPKKKYRKEANPLWEHISIPGIPLSRSYAEATDVMKTWEETGFHPQQCCHFLRLKGGQESENMLLTFLKSS